MPAVTARGRRVGRRIGPELVALDRAGREVAQELLGSRPRGSRTGVTSSPTIAAVRRRFAAAERIQLVALDRRAWVAALVPRVLDALAGRGSGAQERNPGQDLRLSSSPSVERLPSIGLGGVRDDVLDGHAALGRLGP